MERDSLFLSVRHLVRGDREKTYESIFTPVKTRHEACDAGTAATTHV